MKLASLMFLAAAAAACPAAAPALAQGSSQPLYGLRYMARYDQLPLLKEAVCRQVSSYDRSGGNGDTGHYLNGDAGRLPKDTALLADLKGPGCVYRLWSANAAGYIRFYFDGEAEPRIACPMQDLFQEKYPPFAHPLAGQSSGGWYSYLPLPYAKSLRIEVEHPAVMYYHVEYHAYPAGTEVRSFTRELTAEDRSAYETVVSNWDKRGQIPQPLPDRLTAVKGEKTLAQGRKTRLVDEKRGGTLRGLHVKVDPADRFTLRALTIRAYWDGASVPGIEAPLGDFFGVGFGDRRFNALPVAMSDQGYDCFFPMPFGKSARIEVANEGPTPVRLSWQAEVDETSTPDMSRNGYFHAKWTRTLTERGKDVVLLETTGRGHFVGVNQNMQGDHGLWFLEGDEKIYVDGESFPSIYGTGTEDFFTGGWYFDKGPFWLAYHGCMVKDDANSRVAAYRYQITDCVPFRKSIRVDIEHGGTDDYPGADYCTTAYWYQDSPSDSFAPLPGLQARHPASIHARGVLEAESLKLSGGEVVTDQGLPVEVSGGHAVRPAKNESRIALEFDAPSGSYYSLALGVLKGPEGGRVQPVVDGKPLGPVLDTYAEKPAIARVDLGQTGLLNKGTHTLALEAAGKNDASRGKEVVVDYLGLRKQLYPGALEGERARIVERMPGNAPLDPQAMDGFGEQWSGDSQLWFRPLAAGAYFTLQLPVPQAGRYHLTAYFTKAIDYGQVQLSLDGKPQGPVFDGFHDGVVPSGRVDLGEVELTAGNHGLRFTVTGKNEKSTGYMVGLDAVVLEPVK